MTGFAIGIAFQGEQIAIVIMTGWEAIKAQYPIG